MRPGAPRACALLKAAILFVPLGLVGVEMYAARRLPPHGEDRQHVDLASRGHDTAAMMSAWDGYSR